jgi:hypothetical protein
MLPTKLARNLFPFAKGDSLWRKENVLLDDARWLSKKDCKEDNTQRTDQ